MTKRLRLLARRIHLYLGLICGIIFNVLCLTGGLIIYKPELEKLSISHLARVDAPEGAKPKALQELVEAVSRAYPAYPIENMVLYGDAEEAYSFRSRDAEGGRVQIYVNQYTAEVLGVDVYSSKLMQWLYNLHVNLLLGAKGKTLVGLLSIPLLILSISGLYLFALRYKAIARLRARNGYTRSYRLHALLGAYTLPFVMLIAFTGGYWGMPEIYRSGFELIGGVAHQSAPSVDRVEGRQYISLDRVLSEARAYYPEGEATLIFFPRGKKHCFSVRMRSHEGYARTGNNHVYINPYDGTVIGANLWREKPWAEKLTRAMYFVHFGEFWGHYSRVLWLVLSLSVPVLSCTGYYMWFKRRRGRKK